jgi:hypothetical protein
MWHGREWGENCTGYWWESPKGKVRLDNGGEDRRMGLE